MSRIQKDRFYRHENFSDVMIYTRNVFYFDEYTIVSVDWWNKTYDFPIPGATPMFFSIKTSDLDKWTETTRRAG